MKHPKQESHEYRRCVGIFLVNQHNQVFIGQRIDTPSTAWQMPQGGIENNEEPEAAVMRELKEETGTNNAQIIASLEPWFYYDFPDAIKQRLWDGRYRGQQQKWFGLRFLGNDQEINIHTHHPEFCAWRWADISEIAELAVPFKKNLYTEIIQLLYPLILAAE